MNDKAVYRTAQATQGLLKSGGKHAERNQTIGPKKSIYFYSSFFFVSQTIVKRHIINTIVSSKAARRQSNTALQSMNVE